MKKVGDCESFVCLAVNFENETNDDDIIIFQLLHLFFPHVTVFIQKSG